MGGRVFLITNETLYCLAHPVTSGLDTSCALSPCRAARLCNTLQPCKRPQSALLQAKAYGTRCSQAVPHPSTILARRCLTSVIRRERVCSSWYGRRRCTNEIHRCSWSQLVFRVPRNVRTNRISNLVRILIKLTCLNNFPIFHNSAHHKDSFMSR